MIYYIAVVVTLIFLSQGVWVNHLLWAFLPGIMAKAKINAAIAQVDAEFAIDVLREKKSKEADNG